MMSVVLGALICVSCTAESGSSPVAASRAAAEAKQTPAPKPNERQRKIPLSSATSVWGYYGVSPESPDAKRLCYALFPETIDLKRKERHVVYPAQLWVCNADGSNHRKLYEGKSAVHGGLSQSWVDNNRIIFATKSLTAIINANTGKIEFGPWKGFYLAHYSRGGKVLVYPIDESIKPKGLRELDTATGKMRLVLPHDNINWHVQYSPNGKKVLFTTNNNSNLVLAGLDGGGVKVFGGVKPMHYQWFDDKSFFGYAHKGVVGVDFKKHRNHELYRWDLNGKIIEHLAGHGCHGAGRADGEYFVGESWYFSPQIVLRLYKRGQRKPLAEIFSHRFAHVTWRNGGRHHVNPSFSRDGMRIYYNKAVNKNTTHAFCYDLTGLVAPMK
jgi:hypothetical protein